MSASLRRAAPPRPELTAPLDTPAFVAWAQSRSVNDHLVNAQQLVELASFGLCPDEHCMHCAGHRLHVLGIRQRLAAIAGLLVEGTESQVREESLRSQVAFWKRIAEKSGKPAKGTTAPPGVVSHDGASVSSSTGPGAAAAADSEEAAHTSVLAAAPYSGELSSEQPFTESLAVPADRLTRPATDARASDTGCYGLGGTCGLTPFHEGPCIEREPTDDERLGMAWFNGLAADAERGEWMRAAARAGFGITPAGAWSFYKFASRR